MKRYGVDIESESAWNHLASEYVSNLRNDYHRHRLQVIDALIPGHLFSAEKVIFDFGCGDAIHFLKFINCGAQVSGCDVSLEMVALGKQRLSNNNASIDLVSKGDISHLANLEDKSLDALLSFNVLAYMTHDECDVFYREANRLLRPGGSLIVTHSNLLFDMYSLNSYTIEFFANHLCQDEVLKVKIRQLITDNTEKVDDKSYNVRENPLTYKFKLAKYGFLEKRQEFINLHPVPPSIIRDKV